MADPTDDPHICEHWPTCLVCAVETEGDDRTHRAVSDLLNPLVRDQPCDDRVCPDGGRCHHNCSTQSCFRVRTCGPLSGIYRDNEWPVRIRLAFDSDVRDQL